MTRIGFLGLAGMFLLGCGSTPGPVDAGPVDAGPVDAGPVDAGPVDAGPVDAGPVDAGPVDAGPVDAGPVDAGPVDAGAFVLTSTAFADGGTFPVRYTCTDATTMGKVSLPLAWTPRAAAQSYAVVMTDTSNNLIHWVIWDIAAATSALPEGVPNVAAPPTPAGAKQTTSYDNTTFGYRGPCPPATHVYRFVVSALDVATLPGVTTASTRAQVQAVITTHQTSSTSLVGSYGP